MKKAVSNAQRQANARNAQRSTGPRTPAGKAAVSRNALRHGLLSAQVVVEGDDTERPEDFQALLAGLLEQYEPHDVIEQALVERVAASLWRLRRAQRFEAGALRQSLDKSRPDAVPDSDDFRRLESKLEKARDLRERTADDLQFLQDLSDDPESLAESRPMLERLQLRYAHLVWDLPPGSIYDVLLRELPKIIRQYDERKIPAARQALEQAKKQAATRTEHRMRTASLPAHEEVLRLVRYENMLDRQLYRALARLDRRRNAPPSDQNPLAAVKTADSDPPS